MPSNICFTDADEAANALGKWGVDLTNEDADLAVEGTVPNTIKINARDAKKTPRLANSAVVRTRKTFEFKTCQFKTSKLSSLVETLVIDRQT